MPGGINLATKYIKEVDERWVSESKAALVTGNAFEYKGDRTFVVYSIPYAPLHDYVRSGMNRYGTPNDLSRNIQTLTVTQDKGFTFIIDRGDYVQSEFVSNPGKSLARELKEVIVPAYDRYCFRIMAFSAVDNGHNATTEITKTNAHAMLLNGVEHMSDLNVPIDNCYAFCTYRYGNLLMQDPSFIRNGDASQEMLERGVIGMVDGSALSWCRRASCPPARPSSWCTRMPAWPRASWKSTTPMRILPACPAPCARAESCMTALCWTKRRTASTSTAVSPC